MHTERNYDIIDHRKHGGGIIKTWFRHVPVEQGAIDQLKMVSTLPFIYSHVAAMPDCHVGIGCTIGAVIATRGAVSPGTVGSDLGCGLRAICTSLTLDDLPKKIKNLRKEIERAIPHGRSHGEKFGSCYILVLVELAMLLVALLLILPKKI